MAFVEKMAKSGCVVASGGPGQRSFRTWSAGVGGEQRRDEPEQERKPVHSWSPEGSYEKNFAM